MERFIGRQNIEHFRAVLKQTTDPERRRTLEKLLLNGTTTNTAVVTSRNPDHGYVRDGLNRAPADSRDECNPYHGYVFDLRNQPHHDAQ